MIRPNVSVAVVTRDRHELLSRCLAALAHQVEAPAFEVLVGADGDPGAADVVRRWFPDAHVATTTGHRPGGIRNHLWAKAQGELVCFIDDDAVVPARFLATLAELSAEHPEVGVFGGPNLTEASAPRIELVQGAVLASWIGAGPLRHRYRTGTPTATDDRALTSCNLAVRRILGGTFPDGLRCAEENGMLAELARRGVTMLSHPGLSVVHRRRDCLWDFGRQLNGYGIGRGQLARRDRRTLRLLHLLPSAWVLHLAVLPLLVGGFGVQAAVPTGLYILTVMAWAVLASRGSARTASSLVAAVLVVHAAYGLGLIVGLARAARPVPQVSVEWVTAPT